MRGGGGGRVEYSKIKKNKKTKTFSFKHNAASRLTAFIIRPSSESSLSPSLIAGETCWLVRQSPIQRNMIHSGFVVQVLDNFVVFLM